MDYISHQIAALILDIEAQMRRIGLWENSPPSTQAMQSLTPFCHDTLRFEQWLQWVFLVKMKEVVEGRSEWPNSSDITPLAEYRFTQLAQPTSQLLALLEGFDALINRTGSRR